MLVRLLLLILLLPLPLLPAETSAPAPTPTTPAPLFSDVEWQKSQPGTSGTPSDGGGVVGKAAVGLLLSLGAIALVAGGLAYALRRLGMRRVLPGRGHHLTVVETVPLGFKRSVSLLRLGDQVLVVGQGEHDLTHLATLPASVLEERPAAPLSANEKAAAENVPDAAPSVTATPPSAFRATLEALTGRRP